MGGIVADNLQYFGRVGLEGGIDQSQPNIRGYSPFGSTGNVRTLRRRCRSRTGNDWLGSTQRVHGRHRRPGHGDRPIVALGHARGTHQRFDDPYLGHSLQFGHRVHHCHGSGLEIFRGDRQRKMEGHDIWNAPPSRVRDLCLHVSLLLQSFESTIFGNHAGWLYAIGKYYLRHRGLSHRPGQWMDPRRGQSVPKGRRSGDIGRGWNRCGGIGPSETGRIQCGFGRQGNSRNPVPELRRQIRIFGFGYTL
mmetsp:Transcript_1387/g.2797  ORF Transcript_1387/g.2797 Transcript_1387/m.2797 type:complete len:249 (+) Transcript_1387:594-1340(+)